MPVRRMWVVLVGLAVLSGAASASAALPPAWTQTTATLSQARNYLAATSVGNYALFGGGVGSTRVDVYNSATTQWSTASLSQPRYMLAATSVGDYALFGGGTGGSNRVDIFNADTSQWSTASLSQGRIGWGQRAWATSPSSPGASMPATTTATGLTSSTPARASGPRLRCRRRGEARPPRVSATTPSSAADGPTAATAMSLTSTTPARANGPRPTSRTREQPGRHQRRPLRPLCRGGGTSGDRNDVDIFNSLTGQWTTATLSQARYSLAATSIGNYALFGGGNGPYVIDSTVDIFNALTGQWTTASLSQARYELAATTVGNYALFGGGDTGSAYSSRVDIFVAPEPATLALLALGGLVAVARRRRAAKL